MEPHVSPLRNQAFEAGPLAVSNRASLSALAVDQVLAGLLKEIQLLEGPAHTGLGVQAHPSLQYGGVEPPEVVVEAHVTIQELFLSNRRILAVEATLDRIAD